MPANNTTAGKARRETVSQADMSDLLNNISGMSNGTVGTMAILQTLQVEGAGNEIDTSTISSSAYGYDEVSALSMQSGLPQDSTIEDPSIGSGSVKSSTKKNKKVKSSKRKSSSLSGTMNDPGNLLEFSMFGGMFNVNLCVIAIIK